MVVNGDHSSAVMELDIPPGKPGSPFVLPFLGGENISIPCSNSATRLLVTGKETNNAFAVVGSGGTAAPPIGFHFHRETFDVFLCLKGNVNVWSGEKCRTMGPGDFASVPPVGSPTSPTLPLPAVSGASTFSNTDSADLAPHNRTPSTSTSSSATTPSSSA
jgi:mannose-6-phosphate isomerase-like protein (cupin superfamily)